MRLAVAAQWFARIRFEREAHVEVLVRRFRTAFRDRVDVEIVDRLAREAQRAQAGLFARFAHRRRTHVRIAVDVTAGLEPAVELAVVEQQRVRAFAGSRIQADAVMCRSAASVRTHWAALR